MLAVDNFVQDPYSTQSYNRYSYCWNNPLKYNDPSGDFIFTLMAMFIPGAQVFLPLAIAMDFGGLMNTAAHAGRINNIGDLAAAYGIGAAAGAAAYYTGGAAFAAAGGTAAGAGGFFAGAIGGGIGYTGSSMVQTVGNGIYFGDAAPSAKEFAMGFAFSAVTGGVLQGVNAKMNERNFWNGEFGKIESLPSRGLTPIRTEPAGLSEQLTLREAQTGAGEPIMEGKILDPNFQGDWVKMQYIHELPDKMGKINIHYWKNIVTGELKGFKFKNPPYLK